jgi:hypothetical protein
MCVTTAPSVADLSPGRFGRVDRRPAIRRGVQEVLVLQCRADCSSVPARRLRRWVSDVAGLGYQLPTEHGPDVALDRLTGWFTSEGWRLRAASLRHL